MNKRHVLAVAAVIGLATLAEAQSYPACSQTHQPRKRRIESLAKRGDAKITRSIAGHVTIYAVQRYRLAGLVSRADRDRAVREMYTFLKWKLGSPSLVAAQWITAGYEHFDKGYVDECAAMLLGVLSFADKKPELRVPDWLQKWLRVQVGTAEGALQAWLVGLGVPPGVAKKLAEKVGAILRGPIERTTGVYIPKSYDIDNRIVEAAIRGRRGGGGFVRYAKNRTVGRLGRVILSFPGKVKVVVALEKDGRRIRSGRNELRLPVHAGRYTLKVFNRALEIDVRRGYDTKVICGALRVRTAGRWDLYEGVRGRRLYVGRGPAVIGLIPGTYRLNGKRGVAEVKMGKVAGVSNLSLLPRGRARVR